MEIPPSNLPKRHYRWPWILFGAVILQVVLVVLWMTFAVRKVEQQREFGPPVTGSGR